MKRQIALCTLVVTLGTCAVGFAQWTSIGDGIDYQEFTAAGPNNLFVSRLTRSNTNATIDTCRANDTMPGGLEIVRNQAARQDDSITWWGQTWGATNNVVSAINGGYYSLSSPYNIDGGQIQSGWYDHWFTDRGAFSGFAWKTDRTAFHGECVDMQPAKVYVRFMNNNATMAIDGVNRAPGTSDLVLFTPRCGGQTPSGTRTEVLVEMSRPNITTSGTSYTSGTVRSKATNTGSTWVPFDHLVLSADGSDGTTLNNNASVGSEVRIFQELVETNEPTVRGENACQTATGVNWANVFASINTNYHFLENNVVRVPDAVYHPGYQGYVDLNPRTAICWNSSYVFFVVCDGRSAQSVGMSCETLGNWAKNTLGATDGVNLDGGGSSTMIVNGTLMNVVSDGSERSVSNGIMLVNVQAKQQTTTFTSGQTVTTSGSANMRLGPGTNYDIRTTLAAGAQGTIVAHSLNGVYAKGYNWWKCTFSGTTGWVAESLLGGSGTAPTITTHPSNASTPLGGTVNFTVAASGTSPLSYQWQKNSVNLVNGGHYSGATTTTLTVSSADTNDAANYRCIVSNAYGSATSNQASLTIASCSTPVLTNGNFESSTAAKPPVGWTTYIQSTKSGNWTIQTVTPPQGTQWQQTQVYNVSSWGGVYQNVTGLSAGSIYTISGSYKTNSTSATASVRYNLSGNVNRTNSTALASTVSTSWSTFSGNVTASGSSMILLLDHLNGTSSNKAGAFDNVKVVCAP